jgi:hypothetical protein
LISQLLFIQVWKQDAQACDKLFRAAHMVGQSRHAGAEIVTSTQNDACPVA